MNSRIILIEDDPKALSEFKWMLQTPGCILVCTRNGEDAIDLTANHEPDGLIVSWSACDSDPLNIIRIIHMSLPGLPIFLTVHSRDSVNRKEAAAAGVNRVFTKPLNTDEVQFFFTRILGAACGL